MKPTIEHKAQNFFYTVLALTRRNMLLFLRNKTTIFFSIVAPVLLLTINTLFLGNLGVSQMQEALSENGYDGMFTDSQLRTVVDTWMVSGVLSMATLTVALNSMFVMISDKEKHIRDDFQASPVSEVALALSYALSSLILTMSICIIFLFICLIYLYISSQTVLDVSQIFESIGIIIMGSLSAVLFLMCITTLFKRTSTATSFAGIFSALIGFLIGAYLPPLILPYALRQFSNFLPGTHITSLFRLCLMRNAIEPIQAKLNTSDFSQLADDFGTDINMFGVSFDKWAMCLFVTGVIILCFLIYLLEAYLQHRKISKPERKLNQIAHNLVDRK